MEKPKKVSLSKEKKKTRQKKLIEAMKKKKECEKEALEIVIKLIDGNFNLENNELFTKIGKINVCHYEDVVEERFIVKKCGYFMCQQQLTYIPKQQYQISILHNKVYDITERKKFCSDICYKSSKYLQNQLLTSPLWLRESEVIPTFKLLSSQKTIKAHQEISKNNSEELDATSTKETNREQELIDEMGKIKLS
ncbi:putative RNA polymerase II subunit B1 CTD phosphatase RPAP2 homolog [Daktulosphaira vitifoliae]|uniref:putative RNA polymerase II subunit B1 CTD phosphatase RPAP2 homolog n=1 Tax=Daktulosphaira vitifoliae TaxID=58002 RepID=UPI0021AA790E|nr:putative RNA polymerase II subunit B1 CTD phosphatase RPAP2 homolog [Daktulosphaira vitifoliae]